MPLRPRSVDRLLDRLAEGMSTRIARRLGIDVRLEVTEPLLAEVRSILQRELTEMTRMLRQQGDAADEVAEILGRSLARLSAEVEALAASRPGRGAAG